MIAKVSRPPVPRGPQLRVGNLPFGTTAVELRQLFEDAGPVHSVELLCYAETGYPSGFALIVMATQPASRSAIDRFHGFAHRGRRLTVKADPSSPGSRVISR